MKKIIIGSSGQQDTKSVTIRLGIVFLLLSLSVLQVPASGQSELPRGKQTVLKLYVTAAEGYSKWLAEPERTHIIDVRTPEEYIFIGHPTMARNIPFMFLKEKWYSQSKGGSMAMNPDFLTRVKSQYKPDDILILLCRSGGRSARATDALAAAGFTKVYSVTDGFEGDKVNDPNSYFTGKRVKNGWKNSGAPWTYETNPKLTYH